MKKPMHGARFLPHPASPAGRHFDWSTFGVAHPTSPHGRQWDWSPFAAPHPDSPAGTHFEWAVKEVAPTADDARPAAPASTNDAKIEALNLAAVARAAAYKLKQAHPTIEFTSGRRDVDDQARAMASNVTKNRKWIVQTYAKSKASELCQKWVDDNPSKTSQSDIQKGLAATLKSLPDSDRRRMSKHLSGDAFDVQPVTENADAIKKTIRGLPGLKKFLDKEGGLVRWHAEF